MPGATYDGDDQFVNDVFTALNYIIDNDADQGGVISDVASKKTTVNILENNPENNPDNPYNKTHFNDNVDNKGVKQGDPFIIFDQNNGIEFDQYTNWIMQGLFGETGSRSPAEGLLHELGHAQNFLNDPKEHRKLSKQSLSGYNNAEEFRVIQSVENPAALKLGGIKRNHHGGKFKKVKCVTCNN